jgi:hypothetical protein
VRLDAAFAQKLQHRQHVVHPRAADAEQVQFQSNEVGGGERQGFAALLTGDDDAAAQSHHTGEEAQQFRIAGVVHGVVDAVAAGELRMACCALLVGGDDQAGAARGRAAWRRVAWWHHAPASFASAGGLTHAAGRAGDQHGQPGRTRSRRPRGAMTRTAIMRRGCLCRRRRQRQPHPSRTEISRELNA